MVPARTVTGMADDVFVRLSQALSDALDSSVDWELVDAVQESRGCVRAKVGVYPGFKAFFSGTIDDIVDDVGQIAAEMADVASRAKCPSCLSPRPPRTNFECDCGVLLMFDQRNSFGGTTGPDVGIVDRIPKVTRRALDWGYRVDELVEQSWSGSDLGWRWTAVPSQVSTRRRLPPGVAVADALLSLGFRADLPPERERREGMSDVAFVGTAAGRPLVCTVAQHWVGPGERSPDAVLTVAPQALAGPAILATLVDDWLDDRMPDVPVAPWDHGWLITREWASCQALQMVLADLPEVGARLAVERLLVEAVERLDRMEVAIRDAFVGDFPADDAVRAAVRSDFPDGFTVTSWNDADTYTATPDDTAAYEMLVALRVACGPEPDCGTVAAVTL